MACDIRIASENASFGQPETGLGIIPGFGGTQRLARLVGMGRAKEMIFTCDSVDAQEAYRIGLVNKVVAKEELMDTAKAMAKKIMSKGSYAVSLAKQAINTGMDTDLASGLTLEANLFGLSFSTDDKKEGMTAFLEKRKATAYPSCMEGLAGAERSLESVVVDGNVTTSRGLGTAVDFALSLIGQLLGEKKADEIAESVVYSRK